MSTFKLVLIALTIITIVLVLIMIVMEYNFQKTGRFAFWNPFKRKPKQELGQYVSGLGDRAEVSIVQHAQSV